MVFLHFPTSLTEEEQMLQRKYAQLRKKKKQLAAIKNSPGKCHRFSSILKLAHPRSSP